MTSRLVGSLRSWPVCALLSSLLITPGLSGQDTGDSPPPSEGADGAGAQDIETTPLDPGASEAPDADAGPFRLQDTVDRPAFLEFGGELRVRYEQISGQFRANPRLSDADSLGFTRTLLRTRANFEHFKVGVEFIDGRVYGGSRNSAINNGSVNVTDVLEAYVDVGTGENSRLRVGRTTMDLGSRRLTARNRFRNTINSFNGVDWLWQDEKSSFRAFWTMPTRRRPFLINDVKDNEFDWDDQDTDFQFFGIYHDRKLNEAWGLETYVLGLWEDEDFRERRLLTPGFRVRKAPKVETLDFEYEGAVQFGEVSSGTGAREQDRLAWFQHISAGYTFDCAWTPRVRVALDYASGDRDGTDGDNQRFDTLFGARRFEYGPTGIYGAIARSNILSPELRLTAKPAKGLSAMAAWRGIFLASDKDVWTTALVIDPTGNSGRHVGQQLEARLRWDVVPDGLRIEGGVAALFQGSFQQDAIGGQDTDTYYGYIQTAFRF